MDNNSFFSIDRLVEFGLSMAVANQMINTMNRGMQNMFVAGSQMQYNITPQNIYIALGSERIGPLSASAFQQLVNENKVNKDTLAWLPGLPAWQPVGNIPHLLSIIALTPPPIPDLP